MTLAVEAVARCNASGLQLRVSIAGGRSQTFLDDALAMTHGAAAVARAGAINSQGGELIAGGRPAQMVSQNARLGARSTKAIGKRSVHGKTAAVAPNVRHKGRRPKQFDCAVVASRCLSYFGWLLFMLCYRIHTVSEHHIF